MEEFIDWQGIGHALLVVTVATLGGLGVAATRTSGRRWATALFRASWTAIVLAMHDVVLSLVGSFSVSREEFFTDHCVLGTCAKLDLSILAVCIAIKLKQRLETRVLS